MIARRPKSHLAPSDPRAVHLRFEKIAARAAVRAQHQLAALRRPSLTGSSRQKKRAA